MLGNLAIVLLIGYGLDELKNAGLIPNWFAVIESLIISVVVSGEAIHQYRSQP